MSTTCRAARTGQGGGSTRGSSRARGTKASRAGRRRFTFRLEGGPERVGMATGATIHTANGLHVRVTRRAAHADAAGAPAEAPAMAAAA